MIGLEVEIARATLVIGLVISALVYHFFRLSSGGVLTTPFLTLLVLTQEWIHILGWFALSLLAMSILKLLIRRWPLPRAWVFYLAIFITASTHALGIQLSLLPALDTFSTYIAAGLYISSGLTAYDSLRQGTLRTVVGAIGVTGLIVAVMVPIKLLTQQYGGEQEIITEVAISDPALVVIAVLMATAVRLGLRWGTAGIVGSLYLLNILSLDSLAVVVGFALVGSLIYRSVADYLGLSPKQAFYSLLAVGSLASWFGLFWAVELGVPGAAAVYAYPLEPLLIIGLMIGEAVRFGTLNTFAGTAIVLGATLASEFVLQQYPQFAWIVLLVVIATAVVMISFTLRTMRQEWEIALSGGKRWRPLTSYRARQRELQNQVSENLEKLSQ